MEKIDFRKRLKPLFSASQKVEDLDAGSGYYLSREGQGAPGAEKFQQAIEELYGVAYTIKFTLKRTGVLDFAVCALEGLYPDDPAQVSMEEWRWNMLVRMPEEVHEEHLREAGSVLRERKGVDSSRVRLRTIEEGRCLQTLHVGAYDSVGPTYERLRGEVQARGLVMAGPAHEIYLNDPRRTPPERLKTIVRLPVRASQ